MWYVGSAFPPQMKLSLHDKSLLYHELAKLTQSGFGFDKSADLLLQQAPNRARRAFARETIDRLRSGQTIASALHQPRLGLEELDHSILQAAEKGGVLETGFAYLRDHYASVFRARRAISARLIYPAILLHLAAFLPMLPSLVLGQGAAPHMRETLLLLAALYAGAALCWLGGARLQRAARRSLFADRFLRRLPWIGKARRLACLERFAAVFRIGLLAALRTSDALSSAGTASGSAVLDRAARSLAHHADQGGSLASLLPQARDLPADFRQSLCTAELSGTLESDLHAWTANFRHDLDTAMARLATLLPMSATLLVAILVAWRVMSLYFGILNTQTKALEGLW